MALLLAACVHHTQETEALLDSRNNLERDYRENWTSVTAARSYRDTAGLADWLFPDYVVCFQVPLQAQWRLVPLTQRAASAMHYNQRAYAPVAAYTDNATPRGRELCFVSGWRSNRHAGFGHHNPKEYADELVMKYITH